MTPRFGIQSAVFSPVIHAGELSADGASFNQKEDATGLALRSVADYVVRHFDGSSQIEFADGLIMDVEVHNG